MIRSQCGSSLIEAMVAMMVMLTGAAAMASLHQQALFFNGDGRKMTRAAAMASDLLNNLERLDYADPLLANTNASNDGDIVDSSRSFEIYGFDPSSVTDHSWSELTTAWPGITSASAIAGGGTTLGSTGIQLYWNISETVGTTYSYKQIAAIARFPHGTGWRRMVAVGVKPGAPYIP
jgi:Tfp pilus assembly protein PilV